MNDPNGLVFLDGEYHLFYQYFPDSTVWGPMHWGHAVSRDMVHWEHLPIALYPDSLGYIFSGSAVIDKGNTSGLGVDGKDPMIAIFTQHNPGLEKAGSTVFQYQSIAYSNDRGRTFNKYNGNPVIKNPGIRDFRDPKVRWHDESHSWILTLAAYDKVMFYASPDLIHWNHTGDFGIKEDKRLWECPDLFPMNVKGTDEVKWVLTTSIQQQAPNGGTGTSYFIGDFDGKTFKGDSKNQKWYDYGTDNYAMVTWSNAPDGRTLALGWMSNWQYAQKVPTMKWRSAMTLPRELYLHRHDAEYYITSMPVKELSILDSLTDTINPVHFSRSKLPLKISPLTKMHVVFKSPSDGKITFHFTNENHESLDLGYDAGSKKYFIDRSHSGNSDFYPDFARVHSAPSPDSKDTIDLLIYLDHSSVELFADQGSTVMTDIFFPDTPFSQVELISSTGVIPVHFEITTLKGIWK
jgi:fructan beta-fructosidase